MAVNEFLQRLDENIRARRLLSSGSRVLVAVSGGSDSMVLLSALHSLAARHRWHLVVAHFNHCLRGRSSNADERLVKSTAQRFGLTFVSESADVRAFAGGQGMSIEMAARTLRHAFLARVARAQRCRVASLAHHSDDQVELFFLRLLRGAGMEGLAGMEWTSTSPATSQLRLVRPLLDRSKSELLAFARAAKIPFREDASNLADDLLRNRIRHELLPLLRRRYQPGLDRVILRQMEILRADSAWLDLLTESAMSGGTKADFGDKPIAFQRRLLRRQLLARGVMPEFEVVEKLRLNPAKPVSVGTGTALRADSTGRVSKVEPTPVFAAGSMMLELPKRVRCEVFDNVEIRWTLISKRFAALPSPIAGNEWFDADQVGSTVIVRHWCPGDRFQPIGLPVSVKLQDLFTNQKVARARRHQLVVATTASGEIWWVEGLRIGERFRLTTDTRRQLHWRWSRRGEIDCLDSSIRG